MNLIPARNYMEGSFREDQVKLFLEVKGSKTRSNSHMLWLKRFRSDISLKKKKNHWEGSTALEQVTHRGCGISIPGELQDSPRRSHRVGHTY